jgi:GR25 family glycosyltransferase involved in LPS biosynthesis
VHIQDISLHITSHPSHPNPVPPCTFSEERQAIIRENFSAVKRYFRHTQMLGFSLTLFRFFLSLFHSHLKRPFLFQTDALQIQNVPCVVNDKMIFKYKVIIFVIRCGGFHQVVGVGGKDFLFNFCLPLHGDLSLMHLLLSVTNTKR